MKKTITSEQASSKKDSAVRFLRHVLKDEQRAAEVEAESLNAYASRKGFEIQNPRCEMTVKELQAENSALQETIANTLEVLEEAYTPEATRATLVAAVGKAIELLSEEDETEDDEDEDEDEEEEG